MPGDYSRGLLLAQQATGRDASELERALSASRVTVSVDPGLPGGPAHHPGSARHVAPGSRPAHPGARISPEPLDRGNRNGCRGGGPGTAAHGH